MEFVDYLQSNYMINLAIVAVIASWALWQLAARLPKGWVAGIFGLVPALLLALLINCVVVIGWMTVYDGGRA